MRPSACRDVGARRGRRPLLPEAAEDQQRVVHRQAEAQQRDDVDGVVAHRGQAGQARQRQQGHADRAERGRHGQQADDEPAQGEREDDDEHEDRDALAARGVLHGLLAEGLLGEQRAADQHLGHADLLQGLLDLRGGSEGAVAVDGVVDLDGDDRAEPVGPDEVLRAGGPGVAHLDDVRQVAYVVQRARGLVDQVDAVDVRPGQDGDHQLALGVGGLQPLLHLGRLAVVAQRVGGLGQVEDRAAEHGAEHDDHRPGREDRASPAVQQPSEVLQHERDCNGDHPLWRSPVKSCSQTVGSVLG